MDSQQSFYHTSFVCGDLFGAADRYRLFRDKILPALFKLRAQLEALYCENNGRPGIDPVLLCGVTLLQFMDKVSDRRAAEQVTYHLGWKYALDLELGYAGFHPTVLVYFRDRLEQNQVERMIFDGIVDLLIDLGLIKRAGKQRIDSTHILGYVKEMSRLECAVETLRLALEELSGVVDSVRPEFWERLWALYVQSEVDWRLSQAERQSRYRQCGQDMSELWEWIDGNDPKLGELESVKLLRRVFAEQFEIVQGAIEVRQRRPPQAVQNPHDPDAHYANKGTQQWVGYKVHIVETVDPEKPAKVKAEPGEHFITEILTTDAAQAEVAGLPEAVKRQREQHEITPQAMYADAGYVTEGALAQAENNAMELIGPTRPDPHKGEYNVEAFVVDVENQRAVCPQGKTTTQCSHIKDRYMETEYYRFEWGSQCDDCPVHKQCTRASNGRRLLVVGLRHDLLQRRRQEMRAESFSRSMYPRNGIEGTHSELVRGHGLRRTQYRGFGRVAMSHYFMAAACNVKRYLRRLAFEMEMTKMSSA
jgi:transposase